ncbi:hypothetical protein [Helicobacter pylori]|uniref:hypothetical protein n=1 Tax=Helicobacter pylori TaxID=210 RepID=UPI000C314A3A|nr:hypothetical protein [Helicobacter pylori]
MEPSRNRLKHAAFFVGLFIVLFLIIMKRQTPPYAFTPNQTLSTESPNARSANIAETITP